MTKRIGLTGGIGSGKTTVAKMFSELGLPIYIADDQARILMESKGIKAAIRSEFGDKCFLNDQLDRAELAKKVFNNPKELQKLNAIIHPKVLEHFECWLAEHKESPFIVYESAILFESGRYTDFDVIITVTAPLELRVNRVISRDKTTRDKILERINAQWSDDLKIEKSDFVIENIDLDKVKTEVLKILKILEIKQIE